MMRTVCLAFLGAWVAFAQRQPEIPLGLDALLPAPEDNPLTVEKVALGRKLFFDRRLSRNGTIACASCHEPGLAFADSKPVAVGVEGRKGSRRSPRFRYGHPLRVTLVNDTMMDHPMHIHGMWMMLDNGAGANMPNKHTITVKGGERLSFIVTPDETGKFAFHCHLLLHMELGMFRVVSVSGTRQGANT